MAIATLEGIGTETSHARYGAYVDLPSTITADGAANLMRYVEVVVAHRHPEFDLLRIVLDESAEVIHIASDLRRYPFDIVMSTPVDTDPNALDAIIVETGQVMIARCKFADGRRPGVRLA